MVLYLGERGVEWVLTVDHAVMGREIQIPPV